MLYATYIGKEEYTIALIPNKVYQVLPDLDALKDNHLRVIDESDADYLYPISWFSVPRQKL